jgi:hypothetical protein
MSAKNKLPNLVLPPPKQQIVGDIIEKSQFYAQKLKKPHVSREMSLLATLNTCPSLIKKLKKLELDGDSIYKTLYFKHMLINKHQNKNPDSDIIDDNSASYYDSKMFTDVDNEGDEWRELLKQGKVPAPDLGYQVLLNTECTKSGTTTDALWRVFLGSIKEMLRNEQEPERDPRLVSSVLDYFCTSHAEGLAYAGLRSEVEDEMYDLHLLELFGTSVASSTEAVVDSKKDIDQPWWKKLFLKHEP